MLSIYWLYFYYIIILYLSFLNLKFKLFPIATNDLYITHWVISVLKYDNQSIVDTDNFHSNTKGDQTPVYLQQQA